MLNLHWDFLKSRILQSRNKQNTEFQKPLKGQGIDKCYQQPGEANHIKALENISSRTQFKTAQFSHCPEIISSHSLPLPLSYRGRTLRSKLLRTRSCEYCTALQQSPWGTWSTRAWGTHRPNWITVQCSKQKIVPFWQTQKGRSKLLCFDMKGIHMHTNTHTGKSKQITVCVLSHSKYIYIESDIKSS